MGREKKLVNNIIVLAAGSFLPKVTTFITLPILTSNLTKNEYGLYDLVVTIAMFAIPIATLQIQTAAFRFLIDNRNNLNKAKSIISSIFFIVFPIAAVVSFFTQFFFVKSSMLIRCLIILYIFFDCIYQCLGQTARGLGKNKVYSLTAILFAFIYMFGIISTIAILKKGLEGLLFTIVIAHIVAIVFILLVCKIYVYIKIKSVSFSEIKKLLSYSWPMVPNNLAVWILNASDRIVITTFIGINANAIYAVANKIPSILSVLQSVVVMAWHENASVSVNDIDVSEYYSNMLKKFFSFMAGGTALLIASIPLFFNLLIKGDYSEAYNHISILIFAMLFNVMSSFYGGIYIAHKRTFNVGISTVIAAIVNLFADIFLVNHIGIWAGTLSTLFAFIFLYIYRMFDSKRFQKIKVEYGKQIIAIAFLIIMILLSVKNIKIYNCINLFLAIVFFITINREMIVVIKQIFIKYISKKVLNYTK